jgi:hypothetical protein
VPTGTTAISVCGGLAGGANDLCEAFCNAQNCPEDPHPSCEILRQNFAQQTGSSVFPCEDGSGKVTPTPDSGACMGDCSGDGEVDIADLTQCLLIVLGERDPSLCVGGRHDGHPMAIGDVVLAVHHALDGCD